MKNTKVSVFENIYSTIPADKKFLFDLCTTKEHIEIIKLLRSMERGSEDYLSVKKSLPCFTPSIICTKRGTDHIVSHSGYVCLDWDNIDDPMKLKINLTKFSFIAFCGLSCSGRGLYAMIRIEQPNMHRQHYEALLEFFDRLGIPADPACKDLARTRIISYDPQYYYNEKANVWRDIKLPQPYTPQQQMARYDSSTIDERAIYTVRDYIIANSIDITSGRTYWLSLGTYIAQTLGSNAGKSVFKELSQFHPKFNEAECDKVFDSLARGSMNANIGILLNACKRAGVPNLTELLTSTRKGNLQ